MVKAQHLANFAADVAVTISDIKQLRFGLLVTNILQTTFTI